MAEIKKIVRSAPVSNFRQAAPESGGAFRFLAGAMEEGYNFLLPAAKSEMEARGAGIGNDLARQQVGNPSAQVTMSSMGGDDYNASLARTESGGNYQAQNSEGYTGKYQWGQARLDDYNRATGSSFTLEQFKASSDVQERAQNWHNADIDGSLGDLVGTVVGGVTMTRDALRGAAHLGGIGGARKFVETGGAYNPSDSNGTSLLDYAKTHGGGSQTSMSTSGGGYVPPTMLREADGRLTARLYSPLAGPLLQISNAAAGVAYQSDIMLKGMTDVMGMSEQFALNPDGFQQASQAYMDDLVKAAPEMFRNDIRSGLEKVFEQRFLGMIEEKQRDTHQRAANSSAALADRWGDTLAQAVASGNPDAILTAETELSAILRTQEVLPGLSWTPEQSQNAIIKARENGAAIAEKAKTDAGNQIKGSLKLIADAAIAGRTATDESILQNPQAKAMFPDEWRQAAASVMLRNEMPSFMRMTSAEQQEALAEMKAQPVSADWEMDVYGAAEKAAAANAAAWEDDPIKQAAAVLPQKPPSLPTAEEAMQRPESISEALAARVAYGVGLKDKGYVDFTSFFTDEEAATYGALMGKETPPEVKAMLAGAIVAGAGPDAVKVFKELKSDDPVTLHAGMLMARGGDTVVPTMAMKGQSLLDQGLVQPPTKATTLSAISDDVASALKMVPGSEKISGATMSFAMALYAAQAPSNGLEAAKEKDLMKTSVQMALGQATNKRGETTGGVQTIGAGAVLLPPKMSGVQLNDALTKAFGADQTVAQRYFSIGRMVAEPTPDIWVKAGAVSVPMLQGQPLQGRDFGKTTYVPLGGNMYAMWLQGEGGALTEVRDSAGKTFVFDAAKLIEAAK